MERETIYLDNDEEITSAVDKLKGAETSLIDLAIPKQAMLLQSVINLKLLKKQAESLGKEITIVTQDKVGKKLAKQIGIAVIEKVGETPKEVKMSEAEPVTEDDIEFKEKPAAKKAKEDEGPVEFKENAKDSVLAETAEKVSPVAAAEAAEGPEEEIELPEAEEKTVKKAKEKNPAAKKWKRMGLAFGFGAIAVLAAAYVFVPLGNVTLKVAAAKEKVDFNFIVDKNAESVDATTQVTPGREVLVEAEKTQKYTTTGKKKVGTKASGSVQIVNHEYSTDAFTVNAGARVVTASGLVYRTKVNVTVPKYVKVGGVVTQEGKANVDVEADAMGSQHNVTGGNMTVPGLYVSGVTAADIYAIGGAFSGGEARDVTFVSTDDISKAKEDIKTALGEELKTKFAQEIRDGERLIENSAKITEVSATPSIQANAEAAEFSLTAKNNMKGLVFKEEDLKKLAESVLGDKIGATKEIVESTELISKTELESYDAEKGELKARLSGEAYIATKLEEDKIKTDIEGEKEAKVIEYFKNMEGVDSVELRFFPRFLKRMPRIKSHIYIKTTISKNQEDGAIN